MIKEPTLSGYYWVKTDETTTIVHNHHADGLWWSSDFPGWRSWVDLVRELGIVSIDPIRPPSWEQKSALDEKGGHSIPQEGSKAICDELEKWMERYRIDSSEYGGSSEEAASANAAFDAYSNAIAIVRRNTRKEAPTN